MPMEREEAQSFLDITCFSDPADEDRRQEFRRISQEVLSAERERDFDEVRMKRAEDWVILANQVVGAEHF